MVAVAFWAVAKRLLPSAMNVIVKRIEYAQTRELTQLESRLQVQTASLVNSMDIASRISASYRDKTIASVELLWKDILHIEQTFASLVAEVSILTKEEFLTAIRDPASCGARAREALAEFVPEGKLEDVLSRQREKVYSASGSSVGLGLFPHYLHETRPFVREATYSRYNIFTSLGTTTNLRCRSGI